MNSGQFAVTLITILTLSTTSSSHRLIRLNPQPSFLKNDIDTHTFCESWKFSVETNDAGTWSVVPERCVGFVKEYMNGDRYRSDSEVIADYALEYAKKVEIGSDGKDVWVFDIDETLLSNLPYYVLHGYGSEVFDEKSFDEWVDLAEAPALPASFRLYNELQQLGFKIFLLTGRSEFQRKCTDKNLEYAGFTNYEKLILRGDLDLGKSATSYKSEKRQELKDEGYRIHGSSGDQWSDLLGFATGTRSFKLPNPLYYIP
uniref:acid phosphatase 1-like n=1 Tax=Erigeron canadensis TaxID=72917 RepID=UPI001CB8DB67|nr:acid phosphatase 1-like [Erigeron canadensis]